jgi:hypothetical protein
VHSFIHNILWCDGAADTNSRYPSKAVNHIPQSFFSIFSTPKNPKANQSFCRAGCLKIEQGNDGMRAGAEKRRIGPMNALKISLLARANMPCAAQTLLNLWAGAACPLGQRAGSATAGPSPACRTRAYFSG